MMEWLAVATAMEVGKWALEEFGKPALEGFVQEVLKDCLSSGVAQLNAATLKTPVTEAIGYFIKRFIKELQINEVPETSIEHHYKAAIKKFVRDKAVRPILGKAFEKDCKQIDYEQLEQIWADQDQGSGWQFPAEEFDWRGVCKEYVYEVKGIVKANPELRSLLDTELLEQTAANTQATAEAVKQLAGRPVPFDLTRYRDAILEQYKFLQLESLGSSKYEREGVNYRTVPLWSVFVAQNVQECQDYSPQTYEIPKEKLRRLQAAGDEDAIAELEAENRRERYRQKPVESVCKILGMKGVPDFADAPPHPYVVILGDPGSGKSTLLRSLVVKWAQQQTSEQIPLLIELRRYIQSKEKQECLDFVEFIHKGSNWVNHLDQQQLETWLNDGQVVVLLDGLDEVIEPPQRGNVLTQIHSFTQRYSQVPVIVTSRVIGYHAETLRNAGFYHYMLQDLDEGQIADFIQRWHDQTYSHEADKQPKQERLRQAIQNSKAIQELAGNPLLLTLMAILNRGEELPRDRARLYEKASEVLLYQWDVEEKVLEDPRLKKYTVEIDFRDRDKQAMLQRVAYIMQSSKKGLAGNFIRREDLQACLTTYLKEKKEAQSAPSIATIMIDQLRERNFILCFLGEDALGEYAYGFIHRTFLEYFCASEIVARFGRRGLPGGLSFEQLRDQVFGQHWQDENWHEVLRLICGMVDPSFAGPLVEFLIAQQCEQVPSHKLESRDREALKEKGLANLLLAMDCCAEVSQPAAIAPTHETLLELFGGQLERDDWTAVEQIMNRVGKAPRFPKTLPWLQKQFLEDRSSRVHISLEQKIRREALGAIADNYPDEPATLPWLKQAFQADEREDVRAKVVEAIATHYRDDPDTLSWLKQAFQADQREDVRAEVVEAIATHYRDDPDTLPWLKQTFQSDQRKMVRDEVVKAIAQYYRDDPNTLPWLKQAFQADEQERVRAGVVMAIAEHYSADPATLPWLKQAFQADQHEWVRDEVVKAIAEHYSADPATLPWLKQAFQADQQERVRYAVVMAIAQHYRADPATLPWLKQAFQSDQREMVRAEVVKAIERFYPNELDEQMRKYSYSRMSNRGK